MPWKRRKSYTKMELEKYQYSIEYTLCCFITFSSDYIRPFPVFKGILLAILIGFLLGYFIPKCDEDNQNWMPQSNASKNYEADLLAVLDSKAIENISRTFSSVPHLAASPRDVEMAGIIERLWKQYGFEVELPTYEVLLSYPKKNTSNKVQIINQTGHTTFE
ncbi:Hypothetical predicted protein, partial [Paramuricea clavata]